MEKIIEIYTDGACAGNPGPGGAAAIVNDRILNKRIKVSKFSKETTNQRMEILGIIIGLQSILDERGGLFLSDLFGAEINIYSDSAYCINAFNQNWIRGWKNNGWITSQKTPVKNQDLWISLDYIVNLLQNNGVIINFIKVKGHSNNEINNLVDKLAVRTRLSAQSMSQTEEI